MHQNHLQLHKSNDHLIMMSGIVYRQIGSAFYIVLFTWLLIVRFSGLYTF